MPTCPGCGWAAAADARFCAACGTRLVAPGPVRAPARKTVTVMFTDVSGFTALGERLDPESLQQLMTRFFPAMRAVVARHGGTVEKLIGDEIMALFGVPVLHEDDALRAARAALEMQEALDALNDEIAEQWDVRLETHTGINTGEVMVDHSTAEPATYGDAVNVAKRLEDAAAPGEILVGRVTGRLLDGAAALTPLPELRLKGKSAPVAAWRLTASARTGGAAPAAPPIWWAATASSPGSWPRSSVSSSAGAPRRSRSRGPPASASRASPARLSTGSRTGPPSSPGAACPMARASRTGR